MAVVDLIRNRLFAQGGMAAGLWSVVMRVVGLAAGFLLGVVLARVLGPAQFGVYGLVIALGTLAMTISLLGTPQLAVREFGALSDGDREATLRPLAWSFIRAALAASCSLAALAIVLAWNIDRKTMTVVVPGAIALPFLAVTALVAAQLRGLGAMNRGQLMDIVARPAAAFAAVVALLASGYQLDAASALWIQAAVAMLAAALSLSWLLPRLPPKVKGTAVKPWLFAAVPLCMVDLLRQFDGTYGSVMLGWWCSDIEMGLFRAAVSCSVVVSMPVTILHIIYAPEVARLHRNGDRDALQVMLGRIGASATVMVGAITAGCILVGRPLINLVFGPAYDGSWAPLTALCLAQLGFALFGMGPILLAMCHRERQLTRIYLAAIAGAMITALLLVEPLGATGVAAAQIVSLSLIGGLSWWDGRRSLGVDCSVAALIRR